MFSAEIKVKQIFYTSVGCSILGRTVDFVIRCFEKKTNDKMTWKYFTENSTYSSYRTLKEEIEMMKNVNI